ncbi:MAG: hypothetical protein JNJ54_03935 [Myxococcaceae bacterium]|nr:hypothetical protein [Myxococcaceae bacterium]
MRLLLAGVIALTGACRCSTSVQPTNGELRVSDTLDFGAVPLQAVGRRSLELTNTGRAPIEVSVVAPAPFSTSIDTLTIEGGDSRAVPLAFAPTVEGAASATAEVRPSGSAARQVSLTGVGVPACTSTEPCRLSTWHEPAQACILSLAADGEACASACLSGGRCAGGVCVGESTTCDDGNACTVDGCGADGRCVSSPRACPVPDPCQVAWCDADAGCLTQPVDDDTPCGEDDCATVARCVSGACRRLTRPNADVDCKYTAVAALPWGTCALTRSRKVRCWGQEPGPREHNMPAFMDGGFINVTQLSEGELCVAAGSRLVCADARVNAAFPQAIERLVPGRALLDGGMVVSWGPGQTNAVGNVKDLAGTCVLFRDGGVGCGSATLAPVGFSEAPRRIDSPTPGSVCGVLASGAVECHGLSGGALHLPPTPPGGVVAMGGISPVFDPPQLCLAGADGTVSCVEQQSQAVATVQVPDGVVQLTSRGARHLCALSTAGDVYCWGTSWGTNRHGQLAEPSPFPSHPVDLRLPPARLMALGNGYGLVMSGDELWAWGGMWTLSFERLPLFDGGSIASGGTPLLLGRVPDVRALAGGIAGPCYADGRGMDCWGFRNDDDVGPQLRRVWSGDALGLARFQSRVAMTTGELPAVLHDGGLWVTSAEQAPDVIEASGACVLDADGAVRCKDSSGSSPGQLVGVPLPGPARAVSASWSGGCALMQNLEVRCWSLACAAAVCPPAQTIPGLGWPVRQVVGSLRSGCAVIGLNGVQCWGENMLGQLGRAAPGRSPVALPIPMEEPVKKLEQFMWESGFCAQLESGRVRCWGSNLSGQLGVPALMSSAVPLKVSR